ncbi:MAG: histidine kinase [Acetobacteraceae bacterium]|nr:histidine kinase [Acetobacteraceae bacterium]
MPSGTAIIVIALGYLALLFAIAYYGDNRADARRSVIATPHVYTLSIAVYCTSWTFYGSVGRASGSGVGFLPIYLGPTLAFVLGWVVIRKIIRISKQNRVTSIADFIAARYGKSSELGGLVTIIAVVGILPYISLQLKAISTSFAVLLNYPEVVLPAGHAGVSMFQDTELYVTLAMVAFAILFGTRHIDASERHEGMVAAIAFESLVKLLVFLVVGAFVTFIMFDGFADIFSRAAADAALSRLFIIDGPAANVSWVAMTVLAMGAIVVLPRQFQVLVVENVDERHLRTAMWLYPLYLLLINIFVLPIAFAGQLLFPGGAVDPDTFVLTVPMQAGQPLLALLAFIGGLSAATGMIIVESVALSTMVSNDLVMPLLLRIGRLHLSERADLAGILVAIRRGTIVIVLLLGYMYARTIGGSYALVTIGLVSFVAAFQFAPPILAGLYWKGATKAGAIAALLGGLLVWLYTLVLPAFARSGWVGGDFVEHGLFGVGLLRPYALFGLAGLDPITHATIWSSLVNTSLLAGVSLFTTQSVIERSQAVRFVDVFRRSAGSGRDWSGRASIGELWALLVRFMGEARADAAILRFAAIAGRRLDHHTQADSAAVSFVERELAGAIGAASARIMVASVLREEMHDIDEVTRLLDEASQLVVYARRLEGKSRELEAASAELRAANLRLQELDKMKDDFMATVSHEIRTPLTSIRSFSEILRDNPDLDTDQRQEFVGIIAQESERLSRLINDILDLAKMEAGTTEWQIAPHRPAPILERALAATSGLFAGAQGTRLEADIADDLPEVAVDPDRLVQVVVNLVSNAVKFCDKADGLVAVRAWAEDGFLRVDIADNGVGIAPEYHERIFERFQQAGNVLTDKPQGTGLGLPITRQILEHFGGLIWVASAPGHGATFSFRIPLVAAPAVVVAAAK